MVYQIVACHKEQFKDAEQSQTQIGQIISQKCLVNQKNPSKPLGTLFALDNTQVSIDGKLYMLII